MKTKFMKKTVLLFLVGLTSVASAMTLPELVEAVRKSATESSAENKQRLAEFKSKKRSATKIVERS